MEQIRFDFYELDRLYDFVNCELTCIHYESGDKCSDCVLAEHYEGEYAEAIKDSAFNFGRTLDNVFGRNEWQMKRRDEHGY